MSKRAPTFNDLIEAYGEACAAEGLARMDDGQNFWHTALARTAVAHEMLVRALRKAGIPLDQVATGICGRCHSNTTFERDSQYPDLLSSACCGWSPWNPPEEA